MCCPETEVQAAVISPFDKWTSIVESQFSATESTVHLHLCIFWFEMSKEAACFWWLQQLNTVNQLNTCRDFGWSLHMCSVAILIKMELSVQGSSVHCYLLNTCWITRCSLFIQEPQDPFLWAELPHICSLFIYLSVITMLIAGFLK